MRTLSPPEAGVWQRRGAWFWRAHDANAGPHPLAPGPRQAALLAELETVFCAGAWAGAVILAWTLVEAETRQDEGARPDPDLDWLRERRNALVHVGAAGAAEPDEAALEAIAQGALRVVFKTLFAGAWR
ncbi:MAG: hypothetical protein ACT4P2_16535 [Pseudomonadota bacterium]